MAFPRTARTRRVLFVVAILVVLTYPLVDTLLTRARVERSGVDVTATVRDAKVDDGRYVVAFRFPEDVDPAQKTYSAVVDRATYEKAGASKRVTVRVLEDRLTANEVEGEIHSRSPWIFTGVADAIVLVVGLWWVKVGRRRPAVRMLASEDPEAAELDGAGTLTKMADGRYELVGLVESSSGSEVVVDVGERKVVVSLGGRANPVPVGDALRARGTLVG